MQKSAKISVSFAVCCFLNIGHTSDLPSITISTMPSPVGSVMMSDNFSFTATLSDAMVDTQILTATTNQPQAVITSVPSPCALSAEAVTACTFTLTTPWMPNQPNQPNSASQNYVVQFQTDNGAEISPKTLNYNVITPAVYLPATGAQDGSGLNSPSGLNWWPAATMSRFTIPPNGPGTCLTDHMTGLVWQKFPSQKMISWNDALVDIAFLNKVSLCGFSDWRLPTLNELYSVVNYGALSPQSYLDSVGFVGVQPDVYWTSTYYAATALTWMINMHDGSIYDGSNSAYIWAVRGGESL